MNDAFIFDHVRSPRGRGKQGGSLNPITPINLTTQLLTTLRTWLINHIKTDDNDYASTVRANMHQVSPAQQDGWLKKSFGRLFS